MHIAKALKLPWPSQWIWSNSKAQPNVYPYPVLTQVSGRNTYYPRFFSYSYWIRLHKHTDIGNLFRASHTLANISNDIQWVHHIFLMKISRSSWLLFKVKNSDFLHICSLKYIGTSKEDVMFLYSVILLCKEDYITLQSLQYIYIN